jgi:hypothetical protein
MYILTLFTAVRSSVGFRDNPSHHSHPIQEILERSYFEHRWIKSLIIFLSIAVGSYFMGCSTASSFMGKISFGRDLHRPCHQDYHWW